jgi:tetratricopeptide (TPR) repeat protein
MPTGSRLLLWSAVLISFVIPKPLHAQTNVAGKIIGDIRVARGDFPDHPVLVSLETRGSVIYSTYTNSQGRFDFSNLIGNPYKVTVNDDAYEPFTVNIDVSPENSPMNFVQITLIPRANAKKDPLPGRVAGSNPVLIDPAEYSRQFPKKTLKEFEKGVEADHKGNADDAIQHYQKALSYSADFYPAHNNLGTVFLGRSDFKAAEEQFREAVRLDPSDSQADFNLGNVLMLTGRYAESEAVLEEGLRRSPDSAFARYLHGCLFTRTGKFDEAEKSLREALQSDPSMAQAHLQLVSLYLQTSRKEDAIHQLQDFLKAFPSAPAAAKAREVLKRLESQEGLSNR